MTYRLTIAATPNSYREDGCDFAGCMEFTDGVCQMDDEWKPSWQTWTDAIDEHGDDELAERIETALIDAGRVDVLTGPRRSFEAAVREVVDADVLERTAGFESLCLTEEVEDALVQLARGRLLRWRPEIHFDFPKAMQSTIRTLAMCTYAAAQRSENPIVSLPSELWMKVLDLLVADDFR